MFRHVWEYSYVGAERLISGCVKLYMHVAKRFVYRGHIFTVEYLIQFIM